MRRLRLNIDNQKEERSSEKRFQTTFLTQTVIITSIHLHNTFIP
ncbi:hypothetical protein NEISUBOT_04044 [Neisseria subflava NJ9703]|uniref:Uncharacterized protein n=1 Tax=Neisseria subflava NJ9703 TaxID=546268 RepID=A0A9W5IRF3_NEISU|nr:hypothetical protein NEISUBOT_04044 [Neisseria subflava NJ9703]